MPQTLIIWLATQPNAFGGPLILNQGQLSNVNYMNNYPAGWFFHLKAIKKVNLR